MNFIIFSILMIFVPGPSTTTYYLVRHAEKQCEECQSCGLSDKGNIRAKALADILSNKGIDEIYASECLRTQNTARPIADRLGKRVSICETGQVSTFINSLKSFNHKDILIVGHSNQIPLMVQALSRKRVFISDTDFDNMYVVTKSTLSKNGSLKKLTYGVKTK